MISGHIVGVWKYLRAAFLGSVSLIVALMTVRWLRTVNIVVVSLVLVGAACGIALLYQMTRTFLSRSTKLRTGDFSTPSFVARPIIYAATERRRDLATVELNQGATSPHARLPVKLEVASAQSATTTVVLPDEAHINVRRPTVNV
jgi:hypothetical protein